MIAEESTAWPGVTRSTDTGGLGFGFKWNMGWMHDTLSYLQHDPVHRQYHHNEVTFSMVYAYSENYVLPLSHDEVVHGKRSLLYKMPGNEWQRCANLRALLAYMWAHPGKQLLFMGNEIAQGDEWSHDAGVQWWLLRYPHHAGMRRLVADLNRLYRNTRALWSQDTVPEGFTWLDGGDASGNTLSFLRWGDDGSVPGLPRELQRPPAPGAPGRPALCGPVAGDPQHGRRALRRQRRLAAGDHRGLRGDAVAGPARFRSGDLPAAGGVLAGVRRDVSPGRVPCPRPGCPAASRPGDLQRWHARQSSSWLSPWSWSRSLSRSRSLLRRSSSSLMRCLYSVTSIDSAMVR